MGAALEIRADLANPAALRRLARRERNPRTASRMLAIASQGFRVLPVMRER